MDKNNENSELLEKLIVAFETKQNIIKLKLENAKFRFNPRVPHNLLWVFKGLKRMVSGPYHRIKVPKGHEPIPLNKDEKITIDRLSRSFCVLENFEHWLTKAKQGEKKHQTEMEKQSESKIIRLKTWASFNQ